MIMGELYMMVGGLLKFSFFLFHAKKIKTAEKLGKLNNN